MVDRQILAILVPRIKADLQVGDAEMGLLYGTVFALFYAVFSLPLGRLADGWVRTRLLAFSIFGWSVMTALAGFANGFGMLAVSRLGVGIGEASAQPAGMSLLADSFPKERRGMISAAMAIAVALGLGAALVDRRHDRRRLGRALAGGGGAPLGLKGWQAAFIVAALPGFVLAVLLLRLPEPVRGAADGIAPPPDPHPFRASARTLTAILPFSVWASFARQRASARIWATNLAGLALILAAVIALTVWTDGLRSHNPVALRIGSWNLTGNTLQWIVSGFGAYVLLNWLQSLQLGDRPTFAAIARSPAMILLIARRGAADDHQLRRDGLDADLSDPAFRRIAGQCRPPVRHPHHRARHRRPAHRRPALGLDRGAPPGQPTLRDARRRSSSRPSSRSGPTGPRISRPSTCASSRSASRSPCGCRPSMPASSTSSCRGCAGWSPASTSCR